MQKKLLLISFVISLALACVLVFYISKDSEREEEVKIEAACEKIGDYTKKYFRFLEEVKLDVDEGKIAVSVSFIPEVGSLPIKEEIYESVANHALQVVEFFPEVNYFEYAILWDDYEKQEVLTLVIDGDAIKNLSETFYNQRINQNNGFETSYKNAFSSIVETDVSKTWRDQITIYSDLP